MLKSVNPKGETELYTDIGQFIGILPPDYPLDQEETVEDGGPGSGNWGHRGRPGKRGGSGDGGGKTFRTQENGGYISVAKAKVWNGIASLARTATSADSFINSLDESQRNQIIQQHDSLGTDEDLGDYAERLRMMLSATKPAKVPKHIVVQGKDVSQSYTWDREPYTDPRFGQVIDTEIEHVIAQQGFNGLPKVVSQDEFDRIVKEHPEMPILLRSYAAPNAETLQAYDDMLEKGEWYVDCGIGGAQYGQGMYCAGVYGPNKDLRYAMKEMQHYRTVGAQTCFDSYVPELKISEKYEDTGLKNGIWIWDTKKMTSMEDEKPQIGQDIAVAFYDQYGGYVTTRVGTFDGEKLIYPDKLASANIIDKSSRHVARIWAPIDRKDYRESLKIGASTRMMTLDPSAKIVTYTEAERLFNGEMSKAEKDRMRDERWKKSVEEFKADEPTDDEAFIFDYAYRIGAKMSFGLDPEENRKYEEACKRVDWADELIPYAQRMAQYDEQYINSMESKHKEDTKEIRSKFNDVGSYMASLGYDAINAEGHGQSDSYTVVLNRTKVILSNQRVDVA